MARYIWTTLMFVLLAVPSSATAVTASQARDYANKIVVIRGSIATQGDPRADFPHRWPNAYPNRPYPSLSVAEYSTGLVPIPYVEIGLRTSSTSWGGAGGNRLGCSADGSGVFWCGFKTSDWGKYGSGDRIRLWGLIRKRLGDNDVTWTVYERNDQDVVAIKMSCQISILSYNIGTVTVEGRVCDVGTVIPNNSGNIGTPDGASRWSSTRMREAVAVHMTVSRVWDMWVKPYEWLRKYFDDIAISIYDEQESPDKRDQNTDAGNIDFQSEPKADTVAHEMGHAIAYRALWGYIGTVSHQLDIAEIGFSYRCAGALRPPPGRLHERRWADNPLPVIHEGFADFISAATFVPKSHEEVVRSRARNAFGTHFRSRVGYFDSRGLLEATREEDEPFLLDRFDAVGGLEADEYTCQIPDRSTLDVPSNDRMAAASNEVNAAAALFNLWDRQFATQNRFDTVDVDKKNFLLAWLVMDPVELVDHNFLEYYALLKGVSGLSTWPGWNTALSRSCMNVRGQKDIQTEAECEE